MKFRFRSLREVMRLLGASRDMAFAWTPLAVQALIDLVIDLIWTSSALFVIMMVTTGLIRFAGFPMANMMVAVTFGFVQWLLLIVILYSYRALNSAGLLIGSDLLGNTFEYWRTGKITIKKVKRLGPDPAEYHFTLGDGALTLKFAVLQFFLHWLKILVLCFYNATFFTIYVPWVFYLPLFMLMLYSGSQWLIARKPLDFPWLEWFSTVNAISVFAGGVLYMLLDRYASHPYPWMGIVVAFLVGFTWTTEATNKHAKSVAILGGVALVVSYFLPVVTAASFNPLLVIFAIPVIGLGCLVMGVASKMFA